MNTAKQRAFFASLQGSKFLCGQCKILQKYKRYVKAGIIELACGHQRHTNQIDLDDWKEKEVKDKLDGKYITTKCLRFQCESCMSYNCTCSCHSKKRKK